MAALLVLTIGCQEVTSEAGQSPQEEQQPILAGVPSLSELSGTPAIKLQTVPTQDESEIERGRQVYAENCAECHGENLEGEANWQQQNEDGSFRSPPHDSTGHTWHHSDGTLIESIVLGGTRLPENIGGFSNMPAFGKTLTSDEISAVLAFIKSTWPEDMRQIQWEQTQLERNQ